MKLSRSSPRKGFTLVEVILAVGVIAMAILALVGLLGSTFQQVEDVVQTNQAIGVVTRINAALDNPRLVGGEKLPNAEEGNAFEVVYNFTKGAIAPQSVVLYCFDKELDTANPGKYSPLAVVYRASGDNFTREIYNNQNGIGPVFRVEISISKFLQDQKIFLNKDTYEPQETRYNNGPLPDMVDFALGYLPLELKVFPHDFTDIADLKNRDIRPILTQNIVINR